MSLRPPKCARSPESRQEEGLCFLQMVLVGWPTSLHWLAGWLASANRLANWCAADTIGGEPREAFVQSWLRQQRGAALRVDPPPS